MLFPMKKNVLSEIDLTVKEFEIRLLFFSFFYHPEKNFSEGVVFSCVCNFVLFYFIFSVIMITLERLNQSEPNLHTRLLSEIAWPCTNMGFCLPLEINIPRISTNPIKKKKKKKILTCDY